MARYGRVWHGLARVWQGVARYGRVWHGMAGHGTVWHGMGHDYPKKKANVRYGRVRQGMVGYGRVCEGSRGFWRVWGHLRAVWGGMGHDFPEKWTNFLNRPVASTSLCKMNAPLARAEAEIMASPSGLRRHQNHSRASASWHPPPRGLPVIVIMLF